MPIKEDYNKFESKPLLSGRTQIDTSFGANADDFNLDANNVLNLKNKTSYLTIPGAAFLPTAEGAQFDRIASTGVASWNNATVSLVCPVNLPQGAVVTSAIVYGSVWSGNWSLMRESITSEMVGSAETMATAARSTEDTTIASGKETIDNSTYRYWIKGITLNSASETIKSAVITYTTDYD